MRSILILALAMAGALLAGCASTGASGYSSGPGTRLTADEAYIARVEQIARRRGIEIVWVNYPKHRVPTDSLQGE